jgi:transcriptional regulator with XRE-family HTH domain
MPRPARTLFPATQRRAEALGQRLKAARLRRRMSEAEMASRALVSRPTIRRLEAGDLAVSSAILVRVLEVLGLDGDVDRLAEHDELGHRLADARLPRPHRVSERSLADEL